MVGAMETVLLPQCFAFEPGAIGSASAPEWLHVLPSRVFSGEDGRGPYDPGDLNALIERSMKGGRLAVDENHAIDAGAGHPGRAIGWIDRMEAREDGIWAKVAWTKAGKALIEDDAYRGVSPVVTFQEPHEGAPAEIVRIRRVALTNDPNISELKTLHAKEPPMDLDKLKKALGLADDADEAAILAAAAAHRTAVDAHSKAVREAAEAAGLGGDGVTVGQIVTHLQAGGDGSKDKLITELQSTVATLTSDRAQEKATAFVDQAIKEGKPIAATRDHYIARHAKDAAAVEKEINAMPSIFAGSVTPPKDDGNAALSASDKEVMSQMGLTEEQMKASKEALGMEAL